MENDAAIQDQYPEGLQHCYGCGALNAAGLQLKSYRSGDRVVASFEADEKYLGIPGFAYGGLIASLIDCHAMAAAAEGFRARAGETEMPRTVTASLDVQYLKPTPLGEDPIKLSARVAESTERKSVVEVELAVADVITATGRVVAVRLPATMSG